MLREITAEEFAKGIKNPYFHKIMRKVEVPIKHEDYDYICEVAKINNVKPELIMSRCLAQSVRDMKELDD